MLKSYARIQARIVTRHRDRGATAVEYGLMVALIAAVIILAVTGLSGQLSTVFDNMRRSLGGV